jgi:hypothetical protein
MQIRLPFISETKVERKIPSRTPIVADEHAKVFLIYRKEWCSGIDGELRGASSESPNVSRWKAHPLEQERAAVTLNRRDIHELRLAG